MARLKGNNRATGSYPRKWPYRLAGIAMAPLCVAAGRTLWRMIGGAANPFRDAPAPAPGFFFVGGLLAWLVLYGILPRPVRLYVLGHELTHVLGAWISGGAARRLRVSSRGGSVEVTENNCFVVLGPYFFPFYAALLLAAYFISALFIDPYPWHAWWMAGLGICWGFHLTFTVSALSRPQHDLRMYGALFSYAMIILCNLLIIAAGLVMVATPTFEQFVGVFVEETMLVFGPPLRLAERGIPLFRDTIKELFQSFYGTET